MKKLIVTPDGKQEVEMTAEEITAKENLEVQISADLQAEQDAKTANENLKASAKAKLVAGTPLTEEEANVMIGE